MRGFVLVVRRMFSVENVQDVVVVMEVYLASEGRGHDFCLFKGIKSRRSIPLHWGVTGTGMEVWQPPV